LILKLEEQQNWKNIICQQLKKCLILKKNDIKAISNIFGWRQNENWLILESQVTLILMIHKHIIKTNHKRGNSNYFNVIDLLTYFWNFFAIYLKTDPFYQHLVHVKILCSNSFFFRFRIIFLHWILNWKSVINFNISFILFSCRSFEKDALDNSFINLEVLYWCFKMIYEIVAIHFYHMFHDWKNYKSRILINWIIKFLPFSLYQELLYQWSLIF
jgi:hypothetical protein